MCDAWLTFLSCTDAGTINALINAFPMFAPLYQEIADFITDPEKLIHMFSEELALAKSIFRLRLNGSSLEEIADELNLTTEKVHAILEG